jgi:hypothetical protein
VETLLLLLKFLPMVLEIVKMIQAHRLSQQATDEMLVDLQQTADYLVSRSNLAAAQVDKSEEAKDADPNNRDSWT